ncbi:MAG: hypothetical protein WKF88_00990 [Ferruginibacter sp.]
MLKKIHILLIPVLVLGLHACSQVRTGFDSANVQGSKSNSAFSYVSFIPGSYSFIDIDVLDNIYLITETNRLKKIKANGDSVAVFNDVKKYGNPSLIDVSNPLKILVYYQNYSTVVILDRLLSFRNSINFRRKNIFKVRALATSYDNNIRLFDEQDSKLKKTDDDGNVLTESNDFRQIFDTVPSPSFITDTDNFTYLYDADRGFYIFDYYGSFKNNLPFLHWEHVAVTGNRLMGFTGDTLYSYELNSLNLKSYRLPDFFKGYKDIKAMNGKVYLLRKEGVEVYKIL